MIDLNLRRQPKKRVQVMAAIVRGFPVTYIDDDGKKVTIEPAELPWIRKAKNNKHWFWRWFL
jgi:hypothetical protein